MYREFILYFTIMMIGLCYSIDLYWKIKGFFKNRRKKGNFPRGK